MSSPVTVRPAEPRDQAPLGRLGAMLVAEHHDFDPRRFIAPIPDLAERYGQFLLSQLARDGMLVLVAEREDEVVGYAYAGMEGNDYMALRGPAGVLYDLVVDPAIPNVIDQVQLLDIPGRWGRRDAFGRGQVDTSPPLRKRRSSR